MKEMEEPSRAPANIFVLMIVNAALIAGVLAAAGVSMSLKREDLKRDDRPSPPVPLLTYVAAGTGGMLIAASLALPGMLDVGIRRRLGGDPPGAALAASLANAYFMRNIVIMALLEGGAMLNIVAHFIEGRGISLMVTGLLVIGMAMQWPSADRMSQWIDRQVRQIENAPRVDSAR